MPVFSISTIVVCITFFKSSAVAGLPLDPVSGAGAGAVGRVAGAAGRVQPAQADAAAGRQRRG